MRRLSISIALFLAVVLASYIGSIATEPESGTDAEISQKQEVSDENATQDTVEITDGTSTAANNQEGPVNNTDEN